MKKNAKLITPQLMKQFLKTFLISFSTYCLGDIITFNLELSQIDFTRCILIAFSLGTVSVLMLLKQDE